MTKSRATTIAPRRDVEGFLLDGEQWTETLAEETALENGIDQLTARHWQVVTSMRSAYFEHGCLPWLHMLTKVSHVEIPELFELFPKDPSRLVTKIAGIPKNRACI